MNNLNLSLLNRVLDKETLNKIIGGTQEKPLYGCVLRPENPMENH